MLDLAVQQWENQIWKNGQIGLLPSAYPVSAEVESVSTLPVLSKSTRASLPTSVYKYYDKSGILIYVGITHGGILRNRQHNDSKAWWKYVAKQEVEHYPGRALAHKREVELIEKFRPPFNKQHNKDYTAINRYYLELMEGAGYPASTIEERLSLTRAVSLSFESKNEANGEIVFVTPFGDKLVADSLIVHPTKHAGMHDMNLKHFGIVWQVENHENFARVTVRVKPHAAAFVFENAKDVTGYLKLALVQYGVKRLQFKRIVAPVSFPEAA